MCGSLLKVQLVCFGFMATSGDVLGVCIVNSTKFQILLFGPSPKGNADVPCSMLCGSL